MNVAIACAELSAKLELPNEDIADRIRTPTAEECVTGNMLHDLIPLLGSDEAFIRLLKTTPEEFRQIDVRVRLSKEESEAVYEILQLYLMTLQMCQTTERAKRWLNSYSLLLGGRVPIEMFGRVEFPPVGQTPSMLLIGAVPRQWSVLWCSTQPRAP